MGLAIFKRYQAGSEAVPSDLPTPSLDYSENYGGQALRWVANQVREGVLPDEALEEIKRNPTSMSSILAYAQAAMAAGTLLSGGEGKMSDLRLRGTTEPVLVRDNAGMTPTRGNEGKTVSEPSHTEGTAISEGVPESSSSVNVSEPDPIDKAAWKTKEGEIFTGTSHPTIYDDNGQPFPRKGAVSGFVTKSGKFLPVDEAYEHAIKTKQINRDKDSTILESSSFGALRKYVRGTSVVKGYPPTHMFNCC